MVPSVTLSTLRLTRGHLKGSLTKLAKYTEEISEAATLADLEVKLLKADDLWKEFDASQKLMYEFVDTDGYTDPTPDFEEFEVKYLLVKSVLLSAFREREKAERSRDAITQIADQQKVLIDSFTRAQNQPRKDFLLPTIRIEPFSGSYQDWPAFRDMFEGAVHNKTNLTPIQKFYFLKSYLRDEALSLIQHLPLCDATYETAWERLESRYNRPRHAITGFIRSFMDLPSAKIPDVRILRKISDGADEVVRGLISLNSLNRDPWLIFILLSKLDPETRKEWSEKSVLEDYPTIDQFFTFLETRCEALENSIGSSRDTRKSKLSAVKSMHASPSSNCIKCGSSHGLWQCPQFLEMPVQSRRDYVKSSKTCFNCLREGHSAARCSSKFKCKSCDSRHHTLVHDPSVNHIRQNASVNESSVTTSDSSDTLDPVSCNSTCQPSTSSSPAIASNHSVNSAHRIPQTLLPTAVAIVRDINGYPQEVRILIDTGSQVSFITESCAQKLGLKRRNARISVNGVGSTKAGTSRGLITLAIASRCGLYCIRADTYILPKVTTNLPTFSFSIDDWNHLLGLDLADPSFNQSRPIDVLLGADKCWEIFHGNVRKNNKGLPVAQQTIFGWVPAGQLSPDLNPDVISCPALLDIDSLLQAFWTIENVNPRSLKSEEDEAIENHFMKTHRRDSQGKYVVDLPFKSPPKFTGTLSGAFSRLKSLETKFAQNPELLSSYSKFVEEYLALGHMEPVLPADIGNSNVYYLPHHAVLRPDSVTTKLRVVFDGSFKDKIGNSLNDSLMVGPPIQRNLFSVCTRFRRFAFVFTADIVKMFRQIWVSKKDSDFQRILWRKSPSEELQHFRLRTVTYGTSCAPYLSVRTLEQLANDYKDEFPIAAEVLLNDFYVDDVASGANTLSEAIHKRNSLIELLSKGGMQLSKWHSNCSELLDSVDSNSRESIPLDTNADPWVKVLGLRWNAVSDVFSFRLNYTPTETITKRQILQDVARIFDPLGFLSPSVIRLKILFQELWQCKLEWHEPVPPRVSSTWTTFRDELVLLTKISVPRIIGLGNESFELHGFSDASESAYAAVIYARYKLSDGSYLTNIVAAKSRVAPIQQLSIPRLELCGAVLLAKLLVAIQNSLDLQIAKVYAWCDSRVVLSWLSSPPRRWSVFVGNRTSEILSTIPRNRWFHVSGKTNPADCASRGLPPSQLIDHPLWWTGPLWLRKDTAEWPIADNPEEDPACTFEIRKSSCHTHHVTNREHPYEQLSSRISSWVILVRTVARCLGFIARTRKQVPSLSNSLRQPQAINNAKISILKWLQYQYFGDYIEFYNKHGFFPNRCEILNLSPFIDTEGILRVGGRIEQSDLSFNAKHPIILPKGHAITKLIVIDAHKRFLHAGVSTLFALIRQEYWIIGCRNLLRKIVHDCVTCFRQRKVTSTQLMGNLPPQRVQPCRPFTHCGCDYAGPITLKVKFGRKCSFHKGYIALFVCLATKAVHLELVSDLTTEAFLAAFRRFVSRRGKPSHIYTDNGTNFRGCNRLLSEMHQLVLSDNHNSLVAASLAQDGTTWHFIPPSAPHFGGLWEAGVKSVKQHLRRVIGADALTFEQFYTLLTQIEALLNSRPLCQISDSDLDPLTPAHFILGESYAAIPEPMIDMPSNRTSCWRNLQAKIQGYWKRWHIEYLTSLQQRPRWQQAEVNIKVNDLVVIKESNLPPGKWAMGRVLEVHPGQDGLVRVVTLRTASGNFKRPIHKLAVLPVC